MEKVPFNFIHAKVNYKTDRRKFKFSHISMIEIASHCYLNRLNLSGNLEKVDLNRGRYVLSSLPGWTDALENNPRSTSDEKVFYEKRRKN